jgi:hypothetical protein
LMQEMREMRYGWMDGHLLKPRMVPRT